MWFASGINQVYTDIPQLKEFASDPQVQDSLRHMKAAFNNSS